MKSMIEIIQTWQSTINVNLLHVYYNVAEFM